MLELLFDLGVLDLLPDGGGERINFGLTPEFENANEDPVDDVVDNEAPDDAETDVNVLLDFLREVTEDEGQSGFSGQSSGLNEEMSARMPLSVNKIIHQLKITLDINYS